MSLLLIELGVIILGLGVLARLATRLGLSAIPLYLLAGLAFGNGGLLPLQLSEDFVHLGAEIGVTCCSSCLAWTTRPMSLQRVSALACHQG